MRQYATEDSPKAPKIYEIEGDAPIEVEKRPALWAKLALGKRAEPDDHEGEVPNSTCVEWWSVADSRWALGSPLFPVGRAVDRVVVLKRQGHVL